MSIKVKYFILSLIFLMFFLNMYLFINKYKKKYTKYSENQIEEIVELDNQIIPPLEPFFKEIVPEFVKIPVYRHIIDDTVLSDVISRSKSQPFSFGTRSTRSHETTHGINSELRNFYTNSLQKKVNGFYVLEGRGVIIEEPNIKKSQVNKFVPENLKSYRWKTYFVSQDYWEDRPLYIMDEWSAYIIGGKSCVQDYKSGIYKDGWTDGVSGCLDFSIYTLALCMAIKEHDPEYWNNNKQFKSFVFWQLNEAYKTFMEGRKIDSFKWDKQDFLLKELINSPEGEPFRKMLEKDFNGIWLDASKNIIFEEEYYESYQTSFKRIN
jgi:hypothetical protein